MFRLKHRKRSRERSVFCDKSKSASQFLHRQVFVFRLLSRSQTTLASDLLQRSGLKSSSRHLVSHGYTAKPVFELKVRAVRSNIYKVSCLRVYYDYYCPLKQFFEKFSKLFRFRRKDILNVSRV